MVQIYKNGSYVIYATHKRNDVYIVHNKHKAFNEGHTHINNYNTAKFIIDMSKNKIIPKTKTGDYVLQSIIRISTDKDYIEKIKSKMKKRRD